MGGCRSDPMRHTEAQATKPQTGRRSVSFVFWLGSLLSFFLRLLSFVLLYSKSNGYQQQCVGVLSGFCRFAVLFCGKLGSCLLFETHVESHKRRPVNESRVGAQDDWPTIVLQDAGGRTGEGW